MSKVVSVVEVLAARTEEIRLHNTMNSSANVRNSSASGNSSDGSRARTAETVSLVVALAVATAALAQATLEEGAAWPLRAL